MRRRFLFACLLIVAGMARGSEAIPGGFAGASPTVKQIHVTAELVPENMTVAAGASTGVILHLHMDEGWHTYWINPGGAGLATRIKWTLPEGWNAGPIQWPTPEVHAMGPITTYGYGGDVYLLTTLTTPANAADGEVSITARADWLVCQEECIPGKAELMVRINLAGQRGPTTAANAKLFEAARGRLPAANSVFETKATYGVRESSEKSPALIAQFDSKAPLPGDVPQSVMFFPEQSNVLDSDPKAQANVAGKEGHVHIDARLVQNGEKPDHLSGILVSDTPLQGDAKAVYFPSFPVGTPPITSVTATFIPASAAAQREPAPTLIAILGAAFVGGLILNLMPCVLPVLSLKVFSLIKHAESGAPWKQGVAFTAGVVVSFWVLAGLLIALQSAGHHLGWGFQMQSPGFVLALTFLFFLLGLNLLGVFELGTSLVGLDAKANSHVSGQASSFANGALATLAATPCTAPFMGSAVGFAAQQPAAISMLVFTVLALGMAAPYLVLTIFPGALKLVPRPGPWMEVLKQFMGFLLLGTVIFLVYVFGAETVQESVPMLLAALLAAALAAWIYGRASSPLNESVTRIGWTLVALALMVGAIGEGIRLTHHKPPAVGVVTGDWQPWTADAVKQALAKGQPVFVDFTAAWCLSCKANEQVALDIDSTKKLFADKHVALFRGDWTSSDPKISDVLQQFNRNGVPLYLVYNPKEPDAPQVLPEVLTPGIVRDALEKLP